MRKRILYYAIKYKGEFREISDAILNNEDYEEIDYDGNYITIVDDNYPEALKQLRFKPWIIFYKGDISLLNEEMISVIGKKDMNVYEKQYCNEIIENLDSKYGVITGLSRGTQTDILFKAIINKRKVIAVLGTGLDVVYPQENDILQKGIEKDGLVISEYPNGCKPFAHHFPWRNRIIAALGKSMIAIECKERSGNALTVSEALELGKRIYYYNNEENVDEILKVHGKKIVDINDIKSI